MDQQILKDLTELFERVEKLNPESEADDEMEDDSDNEGDEQEDKGKKEKDNTLLKYKLTLLQSMIHSMRQQLRFIKKLVLKGGQNESVVDLLTTQISMLKEI